MSKWLIAALGIIWLTCLVAQEKRDIDKELRYRLIGSAWADSQSYELLQRLCDEAGSRLAGSPGSGKAMAILQTELETLGLEVARDRFVMPGWVRGDDEVVLVSPIGRRLWARALGYTQRHDPFEAPVVYVENGAIGSYRQDVTGKIVLATQERLAGKEQVFRTEAIEIAGQRGARAILFINDKVGNLTLVSAGNYQGTATAVPAYSLTFEEGKWLERLLKREVPVTVRLTTRSQCQEVESANLIVRLPGTVPQKIVVGAHFDSWDVSQGAIDNGIGSAILFEVVRLLKTFSPRHHFTIECVWFDGEELGLWGSKKYMAGQDPRQIVAMINMDMTGAPTGFNVMGCDEFAPFFRDLARQLPGFDWKDNGTASILWTGSDHVPFMLKGIPAFTLTAYLEDERVKYYHDQGDTFDKVSRKYLSEAAAVVSVMTYELAMRPELPFRLRSEQETIGLFQRFKLDERLKRQKEWPFPTVDKK